MPQKQLIHSLSLSLELIDSLKESEYPTLKIAGKFVHSKYTPYVSSQLQAKTLIETLEKKGISHLILIGNGLGYLSEILESSCVKLVVFEPFKEMQPSWLVYQPKHYFTDFDSLFRFLKKEQNAAWRPFVQTHPGYESFTRFDLHFITKGLKRFFFSDQSKATRVLPVKRSLDNIGAFLRYPGLEQLKNYYPEHTAIIVGAGPSLKQALPYLKNRKGGLLYTAIQAAPLLQNESIAFDFLTVADPADFTPFFSQLSSNFKGLFLEASCNPKSFELFSDKTFVYNIRGDLLHQQFWNQLAKFEITDALATVSEVQTVIAKFMGAKNFIYIGCDYSWDQNRYSYRPEGFDSPKAPPPNRAPFDIKGITDEIVHTNAGYYHGYRFLNHFYQQKENHALSHAIFGKGLDFHHSPSLSLADLESILPKLPLVNKDFNVPIAQCEQTLKTLLPILQKVYSLPIEDRENLHESLDDHGALSILPAAEFKMHLNQTLVKLQDKA